MQRLVQRAPRCSTPDADTGDTLLSAARMARAATFAVLALIAASASATRLGFPSIDLSSCGFLPYRPPTAPLHPPRLVDPCDHTECPRAPSQCYEDSTCSFGLCLEPLPKAAGTPCDDRDSSTSFDVCGFAGQCSGVGKYRVLSCLCAMPRH